ncbi:MAG: metallophosphoesterase [Minicystis sp.]
MSPRKPTRALRRHTVVLSDVHLSQAHPEDPRDPLWMRYRRAEHHPDGEFAALVDHLLETRGEDAIEIVYNGDVFDFDAPWVKDGTSSFDEFPLDEAHCAEHIRRIIADHPAWFRAAARLLVAGHRLLIISGNHDLELCWPGVRRAVREELARFSALETHDGRPLDDRTIEDRVRFRAWFHVTEDGIYLEHGNQYDVFSGVRYPMLPVTRARAAIAPQMSKLAFKRTGSRIGYLNPYLEESFYLGFLGYMRHWWERYARSPRHIVRTWFWGGVHTAIEIWRHRHREDWTEENRALARAETGASDEVIDRTLALAATPAEETMIPVLRELWLDRVALLVLTIALTGAAGVTRGPRAAGLALLASLIAAGAYELLVPKLDLRSYDCAPERVPDLFAIHRARAVCMGHTHIPFGRWHGEETPRFWGNSGSWAPAFRDPLCTDPVLPRRPLLLLTSEGDALHGGLFWWDGHHLAADPEGTRPPPARAKTPDEATV